jgi:hypothetical protein
MNKIKLSHLRLKKVKELVYAQYGKWTSFTKTGDVRTGKNIFEYIFKPRHISLLEFFAITDHSKLESTIDVTYSRFILEEDNILEKGADFKFRTIRNLFKWGFRTNEHMVNHYADKLSLPVITLLRKEFADLDILNIVVPRKVNIMTVVKEFETGIYDYIMKDYALLRAGPYHIRDPLRAVA